jgi:hypothetical protein
VYSLSSSSNLAAIVQRASPSVVPWAIKRRVSKDELDRMEGIINEECAPDSSKEAESEENEALERYRRSEAQANMFRADGDEQGFAAGHKRVRMEPVRLSDQARYQELKGKDSNKSYTT